MTNIPHFDYPFQFGYTGHAVVNEQSSIEDVESCLVTLLHTTIGQRVELPEFGIDPMLFELQPLETDDIEAAIVEYEPRAVTTLASQPSPLDYLTALVNIDFENQPPTGGST
jgi:hypothetical protein